MVSRKKQINRILGRALMGLGIIFILYVGYMYYAYYCCNWQSRVESVK
jgi:hypothetical protein